QALLSISIANQSRNAFAYSVRFSRRVAGLPGFGLAAEAWSSLVSRYAVRVWYVVLSGRGRPAGGITPVLSLCTTFSQTARSSLTFSTFALSSISPAIADLWLWQVTQY